jgi:hypothetical protein
MVIVLQRELALCIGADLADPTGHTSKAIRNLGVQRRAAEKKAAREAAKADAK